MTHAERVSAVAALGFTERQAAFLVLVMLHSGVCLGRQYCAFAGIVRGQKMADFFQKLAAKRYATPYPCGHNKARIFHIHNAKLYDAIGQRDVRFRKRSALARAIERIMMLDHIIAHRNFTWLGAEQDKVAHFLTTTSLRREELPRLAFGRGPDVTVRYFPTNYRSACRQTGARTCSCTCCRSQWVTTSGFSFDVTPNSFARFPRGRFDCSSRLVWRVRSSDAYEAVFREELATPLHPTVANELRWFYRSADVTGASTRPPEAGAPRLRRAAFRAMRRAWLMDGDRVVDVAMSASLPDAIARERADWNAMSYLVSIFISPPWSARPDHAEGEQEGERTPRGVFPPRGASRFWVRARRCSSCVGREPSTRCARRGCGHDVRAAVFAARWALGRTAAITRSRGVSDHEFWRGGPSWPRPRRVAHATAVSSVSMSGGSRFCAWTPPRNRVRFCRRFVAPSAAESAGDAFTLARSWRPHAAHQTAYAWEAVGPAHRATGSRDERDPVCLCRSSSASRPTTS